jgi:hypothetical protein
MILSLKSYRLRLLFIGLTLEEKTSIEISFGRYSVFYSRDIEKVANLASFDLIVADEETFLLQQSRLKNLNKPLFSIGTKRIDGSSGILKRPMIVHEWLQMIETLAKPVRTPVVRSVEVGSIVRSKTTPLFGKGVVVALEGENEALVRFPLNKILPPSKILRCHLSQLQILGNIEDQSTGDRTKKVTK